MANAMFTDDVRTFQTDMKAKKKPTETTNIPWDNYRAKMNQIWADKQWDKTEGENDRKKKIAGQQSDFDRSRPPDR